MKLGKEFVVGRTEYKVVITYPDGSYKCSYYTRTGELRYKLFKS